MIGALLLGLLVLVLAVWMIRPLLEPRARSADPPHEGRLVEARNAIYRAILDLEMDHRLGKVSDDDYRFLRQQHESEAASVLREMDSHQARLDAAIEAEISAARRRSDGRS